MNKRLREKIERAERRARLETARSSYRCPGKEGKPCGAAFPEIMRTYYPFRRVRCSLCGYPNKIYAP